MHEHDWLAERFEANRGQLRSVAYRMLGSQTEAEDAVQEAWLRISRADTSDVQNLGGWMTTIVGRICLDMLRSRTSRRENSLEDSYVEPVGGLDPEQEAVLADSVGLALLVVLDTLSPAERLSFVLHDMFAVSFDEIAPIVGRSPEATRQLASRARRRVQVEEHQPPADTARKRELVSAFLAAARGGDFEALLSVLDPDVVVRADATAQRYGSEAETRGAREVAGVWLGRAEAALVALLDGAIGATWAPGGKPRVALRFEVVGDRIVGINLVANPDELSEMEIVPLGR